MEVISIPSSTSYSDLYSLSGYTQGVGLIVKNNTSDPFFLVQTEFQPSGIEHGYPVYPGTSILVHTSDAPVWIKGGTGPVVVQGLVETITEFTGVDLPRDVYTNRVESSRRIKTSSESSLASAIFNGFAYTVSGSFSVPASQTIAMNFFPAAKSLIHKVTINSDLELAIYNSVATGTADGIFTATNLNVTSIDESPSSGQLYSPATSGGNLIVAGRGEVEPFVICDFDNKISVFATNTTGQALIIRITILFEEIGSRSATFGLTASTLLLPDTEMSIYG